MHGSGRGRFSDEDQELRAHSVRVSPDRRSDISAQEHDEPPLTRTVRPNIFSPTNAQSDTCTDALKSTKVAMPWAAIRAANSSSAANDFTSVKERDLRRASVGFHQLDVAAGAELSCVCLTQDSSNSSCLPSMPGQRVQSGLISVMSGARDGNLDNQVRGEPETVAGSSAGAPPRNSWSLGSSGQRVGASLPYSSVPIRQRNV